MNHIWIRILLACKDSPNTCCCCHSNRYRTPKQENTSLTSYVQRLAIVRRTAWVQPTGHWQIQSNVTADICSTLSNVRYRRQLEFNSWWFYLHILVDRPPTIPTPINCQPYMWCQLLNYERKVTHNNHRVSFSASLNNTHILAPINNCNCKCQKIFKICTFK